MKREKIVIIKELRDYVITKRFLIVFIILLLLSTYSMIEGIDYYNKSLDLYKSWTTSYGQNPQFQQELNNINDMIKKAENGDSSIQDLEALKYTRDQMVNPNMPSSLMVFKFFNEYFLYIGMALSMILGFDLISKEFEQGTLKTLLLHPIYRDSIINGKILSAILMLNIALLSVILIMFAVLLFFGIIPTLDNIFWILIEFIVSLLYCVTFLSLAMAISAITKNSTTSILCILGVATMFFVLQNLSTPITDFIMGPSPIMETNSVQFLTNQSSSDNSANVPQDPENQVQYYNYWKKYVDIQRYICTISPIFNYQVITNGIAAIEGPVVYDPSGTSMPTRDPTKLEVLSSFLLNMLVFITIIVLFLGISYYTFIKMDVR